MESIHEEKGTESKSETKAAEEENKLIPKGEKDDGQ